MLDSMSSPATRARRSVKLPNTKADRMGYTPVPRHIRRHQPARAVLHPPPKAIRIVIAGGQPIFRQGLRRVIETQSDLRVVGETSDGTDAVKLARKHAPAILLIDLAISGLTALKMLRDFQSSASPVRSIVLAAEIETPDTRQALKLGARGV